MVKESTCQCRRSRFSPWLGKTPLEEDMAIHSSILAWRIPGSQEPEGYSPGGHRVGHDWVTEHVCNACTHIMLVANNSEDITWSTLCVNLIRTVFFSKKNVLKGSGPRLVLFYLLFIIFVFFFWPCPLACGILDTQSGTEHVPPPLDSSPKGQGPAHPGVGSDLFVGSVSQAAGA